MILPVDWRSRQNPVPTRSQHTVHFNQIQIVCKRNSKEEKNGSQSSNSLVHMFVYLKRLLDPI
jgi:hypothetical protein